MFVSCVWFFHIVREPPLSDYCSKLMPRFELKTVESDPRPSTESDVFHFCPSSDPQADMDINLWRTGSARLHENYDRKKIRSTE